MRLGRERQIQKQKERQRNRETETERQGGSVTEKLTDSLSRIRKSFFCKVCSKPLLTL